MTPDEREAYEERAAIMEHDANIPRAAAEAAAAMRYCTTCRTSHPRAGFKPIRDSRGIVRHWKCAKCVERARR